MNDVNRTTEYKYTVEGQLEELIVRNSVTGDQVTKWHYGTTLADSAIASKSLLRAKVYPDSDDEYDRVEVSYNRQREMVGVQDQNGTEHRFEYDGLGRLRQDRVTALGTGIDGAVRRITRQYDPIGRLERVSSWDQPAVGQGSAVNEVLLRYNGFGQLTREYQSHAGVVATGSTPSVQYAYADGTNRHIRKLSTSYPGGREIAFSYGSAGSADDKLGRVQEIKDATDENKVLARYTRRGISATMRIEYPHAGSSNPLEMTYIKQAGETNGPAGDQYTGQDRFNRIIDIRWLRSGTTTHVDRIQYGFDRGGNRLWRKNLVAATDWDELYAYDGLYQLPERQRGTLNSGNTGLTGTPLDQEEFLYDPAENWDEYVTSASGSTTLDQARTHNKANEIIAMDASSALVSSDAAGNMTKFPKVGSWSTAQTATWDAWNRLVKIEEGSTVIGQYAYDGLTRRVTKTSHEGSRNVVRHFFYSDQWQVLEERLGTSQLEDRTFVWGLRYIDDLILRDRGTERLYATHDQWHVISTVGTDGNATERYAYKAFGATQVLAPNFTTRSSSISGWETTYGAYRWDQESQLYAVRFRYLHPALGRWLSRDPIREVGGKTLYQYADNRFANAVDSLGLAIPIAQPIFRTKDDAAKFAGREACECAKNFTQDPSEDIEKANRLMHDAGVPKNRRLAGHECCGLICECNGKFKRTAPHRGSSALATAKNNAERATRWKPRTKETEPQWAGAECRPFSAKCPKGWNTVAWYHSHPNDVSFSDADKLGEKFTAYVTRCPSGKTDRFEPDRDEKTDYKGVSTYNI